MELFNNVENLDQKRVDLKRLQGERNELERKILAMARGLSRSRRKAAKDLEKSVKKELK